MVKARHLLWALLIGAIAAVVPAGAADGELALLVQPDQSPDRTQALYRPLANFIGRVAGRPCRIVARPNYMAHWNTLRTNKEYDLVLDAAHFTDYRVAKFGFKILAKAAGTISDSLVVTAPRRVLDPAELVGKTVAALGPPSLGAARLNVFFPNPIRQPLIVEVSSADEGLELLRTGKVAAAVLPTTAISRQMTRGDIAVVATTEPVPNMALSASPRFDPALRDRLRTALIDAEYNTDGKRMLIAIEIERFEPASESDYAGYGKVLKDYWGY
jgi:ABC-type phosphate/phosphonate transport system substrate-binding protein